MRRASHHLTPYAAQPAAISLVARVNRSNNLSHAASLDFFATQRSRFGWIEEFAMFRSMKRALVTFCIGWTIFTILSVACSPLLRFWAASRSRADLELIKAGAQPVHARKAGQFVSGVIAGRPIVYDRFEGLGYYINVFHLDRPLRGNAPESIGVEAFAGTMSGPAFPLTIFEDSSSHVPSYAGAGKRP